VRPGSFGLKFTKKGRITFVGGYAAEIGLAVDDEITEVDGVKTMKRDIIQMMKALPRPGWIVVQRAMVFLDGGIYASTGNTKGAKMKSKNKKEIKQAKEAAKGANTLVLSSGEEREPVDAPEATGQDSQDMAWLLQE
jgi:hypothetical protein